MTRDRKSRNGPEDQQQVEVPAEVLRQAAAARAGEDDLRTATAAERRHMGHDVPLEAAQSYATGAPEDDAPPPAYGEHLGNISQEQEGANTQAVVTEDGRVVIRINQRSNRLTTLLQPSLNQWQQSIDSSEPPPPPYIPPSLGGQEGVPPPPPMNVVIQVVGSRGDVQPFVALGKVLKERYGHRVRLATHPNFEDFVNENGLEFFSIGGDPQALMAFMVKNPGLMPGFDSLRSGDVGKRRKEVAEYLRGCWRSCFETGDGTGVPVSDKSIEDWSRYPDDHDYLTRPFVADCIIANPPSFAHVHCAEKLGVPLHIMFTMPYSPTQAFPHPLANIQSSNTDANLSNYISYTLIDMLTWQGLGDTINKFRTRTLGLEEVSLIRAPGMLQRLRVPHTYCWSPALIPKPKDWGPDISIAGFFFLDLASNYTPPPDLAEFLNAGPPPVYIGFGSIVLDDPTAMTKLIFDAVRKTGQRALVSQGWGGVGADELGKPDDVFMLGNCPHDWLFKQVSCVVHHGGAGTTAAGITAGCPTLVVPFFGDQPFWGAMVARAGAGPDPIPNKKLTADNLAAGILKCLEPQSKQKAQELAAKAAAENGSEVGAQSFHQFLGVDRMRCSVAPSRTAVWRLKRTQAKLSAMAACTLAQEGLLDFKDLKLYRMKEYETDEGPWDPISGCTTALFGTLTSVIMGVADLPSETLKALKIHPDTKPAKGSKAEGKKPVKDESPSEPASGGLTPQSSVDNAASSDARSEVTSPPPPSFNFQDSLAGLNMGAYSSPAMDHDAASQRSSSRSESNSGLKAPSKYAASVRSPGPEAYDRTANMPTAVKATYDTAKGVTRIVGAGVRAPMDFTMGMTKGFNNLPKVYGDETVRKPDKITGIGSGLVAAGKGFGLGFYDGVTGLVTQPIKGAQKEGAVGFVKGIGKGIGGIALKPGAAIFGVPGYTMQGAYKELQKLFGSSVQNYIIAARTAQGFDEYQQASPEERQDVIMRWKLLKQNLKKKKNPDEMVRDILDEQMRKKDHWVQRRHHGDESTATDDDSAGRASTGSSVFQRRNDTANNDPESRMLMMGSAVTYDNKSRTLSPDEMAIEEAIRETVRQTSNGNTEEDVHVERGIRAAMLQVQQQQSARAEDPEEAAMRQAMAESALDAERQKKQRQDDDDELKRALAQSLKEQRGWQDADSDIEVPYSPALSEATLPEEPTVPRDQPPAYDPGHLGGTTQAEFERTQREKPGEKTQQEKTEEQIVLEYVKKQSILEAKNRENRAGESSSSAPPMNDEDDEELQRALKLSMQEQNGGGFGAGVPAYGAEPIKRKPVGGSG